MAHKSFTVAQANQMIPDLMQVFRDIDAHKHRIANGARRIEVLELLWGSAVRDTSNPDHAEFMKHREDVDRALRGIQRAIEQGVVGKGLRFPAGGLEEGLVDFPSTYQGRWVYLCWHHGERELTHWHEIDSGYRSRRRITAVQKREMGSEDASSIDDSALDF